MSLMEVPESSSFGASTLMSLALLNKTLVQALAPLNDLMVNEGNHLKYLVLAQCLLVPLLGQSWGEHGLDQWSPRPQLLKNGLWVRHLELLIDPRSSC